jgi:predicted nucleic acid-binding protein
VARLIVFDAGVLIAYLTADDHFHVAARDFMEEFEEFEFAASILTVAETLVRPRRSSEAGVAQATLDSLGLLTLGLEPSDAPGLAEIREASGLKMPDAVVVHSALRHSGELVTTDRSVARVAAGRGLETHLL